VLTRDMNKFAEPGAIDPDGAAFEVGIVQGPNARRAIVEKAASLHWASLSWAEKVDI
jgi:hypothetical protein